MFFNDVIQSDWVFSRHQHVRDMYQHPAVFSTASITPWEPEPLHRFVPTRIDPPEHVKYHQIPQSGSTGCRGG